MTRAVWRESAKTSKQDQRSLIDTCGDAEFGFVMTPHRSLSDPAFLLFILSILAICVAAQLYFVMNGVWVAAVAALFDGTFLIGAFIACRKDRRRTETLQFRNGRLTSVQRRGNGEIIATAEFPAFGLTLSRKFDSDYGCLRLELVQNGRRFEIASELSPVERSSLSDALASELKRRGLGVRIETT
ncbi:DUF2244 domain-containing protein [Aestuariivirga sp.]|uniref:DUF2244 domain-containing protein n=1 Tax=Aestuariivirga sp. TaxID=2650926 RepID=UPI003BA92804